MNQVIEKGNHDSNDEKDNSIINIVSVVLQVFNAKVYQDRVCEIKRLSEEA